MNSKYKPKCRKPLSQRKRHKGNVSAFTKRHQLNQMTESTFDLDHAP